MVTTPYPVGQGPIFHCTRPGLAGTRCTWTGFPVEADPCPFHPTGERHRYEPTNFDAMSFQPLWNYAERCLFYLDSSEFMAMGCHAWFIDGVPTVVFDYKHGASRNYLHVDALGCSAWTIGPWPQPVPAAKAIEHALGMLHYHGDGCLEGSRAVTIERRRKAE